MKKFYCSATLALAGIALICACKSGRGHHGGVHNNFCFTGDTRVALQGGSLGEISKLHTGDVVESFNAETQRVEAAIVLEMKSVKHDNLVKLSFETTQLRATSDHPVWVKNKGWASLDPGKTMECMKLDKVSLLQEGDVCLFLDAGGKTGESRLLKTEPLQGEFETYTITKLSRNSMFFANGIIVAVEELRVNPL